MTGEDPVWADLWDRLKVFFGALVDEFRECNQRLGSLPGHHQTTAFPFTGYVSLCRTAPSLDEDLVLTWSIAWREGHLIGSADIARGDGTVLAVNVPAELPDPVRRTRLFAEQDRAMRFFLDNLDLIKREVC